MEANGTHIIVYFLDEQQHWGCVKLRTRLLAKVRLSVWSKPSVMLRIEPQIIIMGTKNQQGQLYAITLKCEQVSTNSPSTINHDEA